MASIEERLHEPIAVIGMGCRFPGGANDPDRYWQLLREGRDATSEIPKWRWPVNDFFSSDLNAPGRMYTRRGGFVEGIEDFDSEFFGISPRESLKTDPQQRLLLEVSWETFENAALPPEGLAGSRTGVFVGITGSDYAQVLRAAGEENLDAYHLTGCCPSFGPGRISYLLGLQGPSLAVDTACSSSLVAVDLACRSLRAGQCDLALAGGVNALLIPDAFVTTSKARMLAPDGRCKTFDAAANGFARAEGCGMVLLRRLSEARERGDRVLAVILGSAVNQDGKSSGMTVPNRLAQEAVIRQALESAGVTPEQVQYVEAHGTGTPLGDPIEVRALAAVLGQGRTEADAFYLGSAKTNLGHLESAAGIAGLLKAVLALERKEIPPHLHFRNPTPHVPWDDIPVRVPTRATPWPPGHPRRIAGISSFGASGTNAHAILAEAPEVPEPSLAVERPLHLATITARTETALRAAIERADKHLELEPGLSFADFCFTRNAGRSHFEHRVSVVCATAAEAREKLGAYLAGGKPPGVVTSRVSAKMRPRIAFLFSGQGSQYADMGRRLYETSPTFAKALDRCQELLRPHLERPLLSVLFPGDGERALLNQTQYAQPGLFAVEYALCELLRSWGVEPAFVLGHSVGEYVAACLAGVFSLEEGLKLISDRARLMQARPPGGRMVAVRASAERVASVVGPFSGTVSVAAINGPRNTVISGLGADVEAIVKRFADEGVACKELTVSHAFHSPMMEPMLAAFERSVSEVKLRPPRLPLISNLTGRLANAEEVTRPEYWRRHVREPVRFAAGMESLAEAECELFLEVGPTPVLLGMGAQCVKQPDVLWLPTLRPNHDDWDGLLASLQQMYHAGVAVDWNGFDGDFRRRKVGLPTYPFQRERFWVESKRGAGATQARPPAAGAGDVHPLLGSPVRSPALKDSVFQAQVSAERAVYLKDHQIGGRAIFPAAAYIEMALSGASRLFGPGPQCLEAIAFQAALELHSGAETTMQTVFRTEHAASSAFEVFSALDGGPDLSVVWTRHAVGRAVRTSQAGTAHNPTRDLRVARDRCSRRTDITEFYQRLSKHGPDFGPSFRNVVALWRGAREALAQVTLPESLRSGAARYRFHPALLDACLQASVEALFDGPSVLGEDDLLLPVAMESIQILSAVPVTLWSYARPRGGPERGDDASLLDLQLYDQDGGLVASIAGLQLRRVKRITFDRTVRTGEDDWLFDIQWRETPLPKEVAAASSTPLSEPGGWLILADAQGVGQALQARLSASGQKCILARPGSAFARLAEDQFALDPTNPADFERILAEARGTPERPLLGVFHLWQLDCPAFDAMTAGELARAQLLGCGAALHLVQALASIAVSLPPFLWLVTRGAQPASGSSVPTHPAMTPLWGLGRVISAEHPELRCRRLDLDSRAKRDAGDVLFEELCRGEFGEDEIAFRDQARLAPRLVRMQLAPPQAGPASTSPPSKPVRLEVAEPGMFESLRWCPAERVAPGINEIEIRVEASGLNFRDVLCALGMYPGATGPLGGECAGVVTLVGGGVRGFKAGDRVMAFAPASFSTYVTVRADFAVPMPAGLTPAQAASIPVTFLTALYGLRRLANLKAGDRVLIHAAAGGVGLAAVQLAQQAGAEVFATAGSGQKRDHLAALGVKHLYDSRSLAFADEIERQTGGRGMNVIINSLSGEFIAKSISVLAPGGRFLELGKRGIWTRERFAAVRPDCGYFAYDLGEAALADPALLPGLFGELLPRLEAGKLRPLPLTCFSSEQAAEAFRFMAQAKHVGKIVVTMPGSKADCAPSPRPPGIRGDATYLVSGGLGGLGLHTAGWLVEQGARHVVLFGRRPPSPAAQAVIEGLRTDGVTLTISTCDAADEQQLAGLFNQISASMPPLRGIIHAAGILDDGVLTQQSWGRFERVMAPKVRGAWNLHRLSLNSTLDFFVLFSAAAAILGSRAQGSYAAANAFMDGLAHHRKASGLPALSINWGAWAGVGMAARLETKDSRRWAERGLRPIGLEEGTARLGQLLAQSSAQVVALPMNWSTFLAEAGPNPPPALFWELLEVPRPHVAREADARAKKDLVEHLSLEPPARRLAALTAHVESLAARALGLAPERPLDPHRPYHELGLDSLMSVELRNALAASLRQSLPATLLYDYPTTASLVRHLAEDVLHWDLSDRPAPAALRPCDRDLKELEQMPESEAESVLLAELAQLEKR
jgi:acyl transferase domain-containing protein/NADPH:quinone reductase-like Zn-dependent oxidoreductase/nucleoside-diphosphate-sugar epimerase